ncbi:MAG: MFS transporter [bacterium]|nr:MFS transporter [bacterium]
MEKKSTPRTIKIFSIVSFLNDFGSDIIYPIWPLFVKNVLGANMAVLGLIDGLGDAIVSISQAVSGYISDRIRKRKIFIWLGYLCGSLSRIGYALTTTWHWLIPFRILDRAGKIRAAPRDAIIADISIRENRGRNFGLLRTMDNLGAVCGTVFCILLFKFLGYKNLFLFAAIPSIIGVLLVLFFIKDAKTENIKIYKGLNFKDLDKNFRLFLFLSSLFALGSFSYSFLLIYAEECGCKTAFVPVLYLVFSGIAAIFSLFFGKLSDKIGRKSVLIMAFILWGLVCLNFIFFDSRIAIVLTFVLYGLHKAALDTVQKTFVSELSPVEYRASTLGGFQMVIGLCALPASLAAGMMWDKINIHTPFYCSLGLTTVAVIMMLFVKEKK